MSFMGLHLLPHIHWAPLVAAYGYWLIFLVIALESAGVPFPGEAMLITAAVYAGHTHRLDILAIVAIAAFAGTFGGVCGYVIGRAAGMPLLRRYGRYVGLDERRLRLGEYIFNRHGGKILFFGRFVSILRAFASLLAGASGLGWRRFLFFTVGGALAWSASFGFASYFFGRIVHQIVGPLGLATLVLGAAAVATGWLLLRRHEAELQARADAAAGL
jgi:membrane protein DedA with SNARE-associated domain